MHQVVELLGLYYSQRGVKQWGRYQSQSRKLRMPKWQCTNYEATLYRNVEQ